MTAPSYFSFFSLTVQQVAGMLAVGVVALVLVVLGAMVFGPRRVTVADLFVGWGLAVVVFVGGGALGGVPLGMLGIVVAGFAFAGVGWRAGAQGGLADCLSSITAQGRILAIGTPLLVLAAAMSISQWDEFTQWVPNALYLLRFDSVPRADLPISPSVFPAYPYGMPMLVYAASRLAGGLVEPAGGLFNVLLLLALAPAYLWTVRLGLGATAVWARGWRAAALGVLGVTVLSGTFVQKLVFTHYADVSTAVVFAMAGFLLWRLLNRLAGDEDGEVGKIAWQAGFVFAVFVFLKQTNPVLMALLFAGAGVVVLRDPSMRAAVFLRQLPALLLPSVIVYLGWRYHVAHNIQAGEFSILPRDRWLLDHIFTIFAKMAEIASKKGYYFAVMLALSVAGAWNLFRFRGRFSRLSILIGTTFVGYTLFLWLMYVIAFGEYEGMRAASFWRYNTQLGLLSALGAAYGVALLWRRHVAGRSWAGRAGRSLGVLALVLAVGAPLGAADKIRFDVRPQKQHMRTVAAEAGATLPPGSRIVVVDPHGIGIAAMIVRFEVTSGTGAGRNIVVQGNLSMFHKEQSPAGIRAFVDRDTVTHLIVHESLPAVAEALGVTLPEDAVTLLERAADGWRVAKAWPYPGFTNPNSMPD